MDSVDAHDSYQCMTGRKKDATGRDLLAVDGQLDLDRKDFPLLDQAVSALITDL